MKKLNAKPLFIQSSINKQQPRTNQSKLKNMNVTEYTRIDFNGKIYNRPSIQIDIKGRIYLNKNIVSALKLKAGQRISFLQDEDHPKDWYLKLTENEEGFGLLKNSSGSLHLHSTGIAKKILSSINRYGYATSFVVSVFPHTDYNDLYAIFTGSAHPKINTKNLTP